MNIQRNFIEEMAYYENLSRLATSIDELNHLYNKAVAVAMFVRRLTNNDKDIEDTWNYYADKLKKIYSKRTKEWSEEK